MKRKIKVFLLDLDNPFLHIFDKFEIDKNIFDNPLFILTKKHLNDKELGDKINNKDILGVISGLYWEGSKLFGYVYPKNILCMMKIKTMLKLRGDGIIRAQGRADIIVNDSDLQGWFIKLRDVKINNFYILGKHEI